MAGRVVRYGEVRRSDRTGRDSAGRDDAGRAALLAFVRLYELGALRYLDETGAAVHQGAGHPSPKDSSGRRPVVRRSPTDETAPLITWAVCLHDEDDEG